MKRLFVLIGLAMLCVSAFATQLPAGVPVGTHKVKLPAAKTNPFDTCLEYTFVSQKPETYYVVEDGALDTEARIVAGDSFSVTLCPKADGTYPKLTVYER